MRNFYLNLSLNLIADIIARFLHDQKITN